MKSKQRTSFIHCMYCGWLVGCLLAAFECIIYRVLVVLFVYRGRLLYRYTFSCVSTKLLCCRCCCCWWCCSNGSYRIFFVEVYSMVLYYKYIYMLLRHNRLLFLAFHSFCSMQRCDFANVVQYISNCCVFLCGQGCRIKLARNVVLSSERSSERMNNFLPLPVLYPYILSISHLPVAYLCCIRSHRITSNAKCYS